MIFSRLRAVDFSLYAMMPCRLTAISLRGAFDVLRHAATDSKIRFAYVMIFVDVYCRYLLRV